MLYRDPISLTNQRRGRPLLWMAFGLLVLAIPAYLFGPRLYYRYSDDPLSRMERRAQAFLKLQAEGSPPDLLLKQVDESLTILKILEKDQAYEPQIQYYFGLFQFFELIVRVDPVVPNLLQLAGRGYLPVSRETGTPRTRSLTALGRRIGLRMRRALAMRADFPQADVARLALIYADLFYTARTDRILQNYMAGLKRAELPAELWRPYDWMAILLDVVGGEPARLQKRLAEKKGGLLIQAPDRALLGCYASFRAARYLEALNVARALQSAEDNFRQVEAIRMEGEVFLKQRGARTALPYFQQALRKSGGTDAFLKGRIRAASEK